MPPMSPFLVHSYRRRGLGQGRKDEREHSTKRNVFCQSLPRQTTSAIGMSDIG